MAGARTCPSTRVAILGSIALLAACGGGAAPDDGAGDAEASVDVLEVEGVVDAEEDEVGREPFEDGGADEAADDGPADDGSADDEAGPDAVLPRGWVATLGDIVWDHATLAVPAPGGRGDRRDVGDARRHRGGGRGGRGDVLDVRGRAAVRLRGGLTARRAGLPHLHLLVEPDLVLLQPVRRVPDAADDGPAGA
jgi:hypothetical protein